MSDRPVLRALAARAGIHDGYRDLGGRWHDTADFTRERLLAGMGLSASTEAAAAAALADLQAEEELRALAPSRVAARSEARCCAARLTGARGAEVHWDLELRLEDGTRLAGGGRATAAPDGGLRLPLPGEVPEGYHRLRLDLRSGAARRSLEQRLIVVPPACPAPEEMLGGQRAFGILVNLYTVRSRRNHGVGNFGDLQEILRWSARAGASFVGLNPLHALRNRGLEVSPYRPVSRLYRNPIYLDVSQIPELADAGRAALLGAGDAELRRLRTADRVDYEGVRRLHEPVLSALHRSFAADHRDRDTPRGRAYARYRSDQGEPLDDFATFFALWEQRVAAFPDAADWRQWPPEYRHPHSPAVRAFRAAHPEQVDRHRYLQFELDRQLAAAAAAGRRAGLPVGLYQDLAIGTAPEGSDPWAFPGCFTDGISLGAPPDDFAAEGQDWAFPPLHPQRLARDGYEYWIRVVRAAVAHAGGLRIDHVMGVERQFWIPEGSPAAEGAYVSFPAEELMGILALESRRQGALVVGEDLGTVPEGFARRLERWGILSCRVLYFERSGDGAFRPASDYPRRALVTVNTHDLAPLAGYWNGADIELRHRLGANPQSSVEAARQQRRRECEALEARLRLEGVAGWQEGTSPAAGCLAEAVHAFLDRTPSPLVGVSLDDLAGETEPVNLPGIGSHRHPSWTRRMRLGLEEIPADSEVQRGLRGVSGRARRR